MRQMRLQIGSHLLYESFFDPKTGNLIRRVAPWEEALDYNIGGITFAGHRTLIPAEVQNELQKTFPHRYRSTPSPSPELIDVSITDKCGFGCDYCYQDSKPKRPHAKRALVPTLLKGLKTPPYQIAIGGGEPCGVPSFPDILREVREFGTIPNYTTAGHIFRPEVIAATNDVCGGVALTFHAFKGFDWFEQTYRRWQAALKCQLNIHLIADKDAAKNLTALVGLQKKVGKLSVVLLAYYPDVGRATMDTIMTRRVYTHDLPMAVTHAKASGMSIAFSEGLLPFFLSRPEIGINTDFATRSEGAFSCYVDPKGHMSKSSFDRSRASEKTIFSVPAQELWQDLADWSGSPGGEACFDCKHRATCSTPSEFHYFACAFASHNKLPLTIEGRSRYERLKEDES